MKLIEVKPNTISGQSKCCWLSIQFRYTKIYFVKPWVKDPEFQGISIDFFAPVHNPKTGYKCIGFGIRNNDRAYRQLLKKRAELKAAYFNK